MTRAGTMERAPALSSDSSMLGGGWEALPFHRSPMLSPNTIWTRGTRQGAGGQCNVGGLRAGSLPPRLLKPWAHFPHCADFERSARPDTQGLWP